MECVSCGVEINPLFKSAIKKNECPSCNGPIMPDDTKILMEELADAMLKMPNDPQGVVGWLLSNYHCKKKGTEPVQPIERFYNNKNDRPQNPYQEPVGMKVDTSYEQFLKRTDMHNRVTVPNEQIEMVKAVKNGGIPKVANSNNNIAAMAQQILAEDDPYGQENPMAPSTLQQTPYAPIAQEDLKAFQEYQAAGVNPFMNGMVTSLATTKPARVGEDSDPQVQAHANALSKLLGGELAAGLDDESLLPLEQQIAGTRQGLAVIQQQRFKKLKAQEALSGASKSSFTR